MSAEHTASLILGTAGHIDHGKSSLIKVLTGTDPDRLAEEKKRGITIELGFAQLKLPSGRTMGVVDVPGHEKFVRQMVAGATGVDVALLVIAADDGIMPQTVEHLAVLSLLGVKSCVVALTKTDLADPEWVEFVTDEVRARLAETPFAEAPIVGVSSRTGEGIPDLLAALGKAAAAAERTKAEGPMRMPIDRVFTVKGFGTVVTGTLWSGQVSAGDELEVLPEGTPARVRSVQEHGESCEVAYAGNRVAVCLGSLSTEEVRPGDFLAAPGTVEPSDRFDALLRYADPMGTGKPLETGVRVHVAHGTREVLGRVLLMNGRPALRAGEEALAQIRLEAPLPVSYRDRFIVRSYSPVRVIGGGTVLAAHPRRRTNLAESEQALLSALEQEDPQTAVEAFLDTATVPLSTDEVARATGLPAKQTLACLETAVASGRTARLAGKTVLFARTALVQKSIAALERALLNFHTANPEAPSIPKEELRRKALPSFATDAFDSLLAVAGERNVAVVSEGGVSHPKAGAGAKAKEREAAKTILALLQETPETPPDVPAIVQATGLSTDLARRALAALVQEGSITRIDADRFYVTGTIERWRGTVAGVITANGPATAADLKDAMGVTRKYAMPVLEYFDSIGFTRREGDTRVLV